jgi:hypothetical protein
MLPNKLEKIKKEFYLMDLLHKKAKFENYVTNDSTACYSIKDETTLHEINIICDEAMYFKKMKVIDILHLKNICFLSHGIYCRGTKELIHSEKYAPLLDSIDPEFN